MPPLPNLRLVANRWLCVKQRDARHAPHARTTVPDLTPAPPRLDHNLTVARAQALLEELSVLRTAHSPPPVFPSLKPEPAALWQSLLWLSGLAALLAALAGVSLVLLRRHLDSGGYLPLPDRRCAPRAPPPLRPPRPPRGGAGRVCLLAASPPPFSRSPHLQPAADRHLTRAPPAPCGPPPRPPQLLRAAVRVAGGGGWRPGAAVDAGCLHRRRRRAATPPRPALARRPRQGAASARGEAGCSGARAGGANKKRGRRLTHSLTPPPSPGQTRARALRPAHQRARDVPHGLQGARRGPVRASRPCARLAPARFRPVTPSNVCPTRAPHPRAPLVPPLVPPRPGTCRLW